MIYAVVLLEYVLLQVWRVGCVGTAQCAGVSKPLRVKRAIGCLLTCYWSDGVKVLLVLLYLYERNVDRA